MFSNMYNHFELEQGLKDDLDTTGNFNDLLYIFVKKMIHCSWMYVKKINNLKISYNYKWSLSLFLYIGTFVLWFFLSHYW